MVKRQHRLGEWRQCLGSYAELRRKLINMRAASPSLSERDRSAVQGLVRTLYDMERVVEEAVEKAEPILPSRLNRLLSSQIDDIVEVLARVSQQEQGAT